MSVVIPVPPRVGRLGCVAVFAALGLVIPGNVPPPPDPPPDPPSREGPLMYRPALLLDTMKPATAQAPHLTIACGQLPGFANARSI
jgi:hypothetical protein